VLIACFSTIAFGGCRKHENSSASFDSPEACFAAAQAALAKRDFRTYTGCVTPDMQTRMCAGFIRLTLGFGEKLKGVKARPEDAAKLEQYQAAVASMEKVLDKHGVKKEQLPSPAEVATGRIDYDPRFLQAATEIEDKPAFFAEMVAAVGALFELKIIDTPQLDGTIETVTIDGDTATAAFKASSLGRDGLTNISFRKSHAGWLIHELR
jgi:hypothetical protein